GRPGGVRGPDDAAEAGDARTGPGGQRAPADRRRAELPRVQVRPGEDAVDTGLPAEPDDALLPGLQDDWMLEAGQDPERQRRPGRFRRLRLASPGSPGP